MKEINEYDDVRIKATGVIGQVIDIGGNKPTLYTVETFNDEKQEWEFYRLHLEEIEPI